MAHEIPLQTHGVTHTAPGGKTKKGKHHQAKIRLPNGQKPDFGPAKDRPPQLPNGEKPDFGTGDAKKDQTLTSKGKKSKKQAKKDDGRTKATDMSSSSSSNNSNNVGGVGSSGSVGGSSGGGSGRRSTKSGELRSSGKNADCYAGSSFHSSPEALALPKPSFAASSSPSQSAGSHGSPPQAVPMYHSPAQNLQPLQPRHPGSLPLPMHQSPMQQFPPSLQSGSVPLTANGMQSGQYNLHPAFVYQGVRGSGPPQYPITSYPVPKQEYSYAPMMGYPVPPAPMHPYPFAAAPHVPQPGQRISFNDLIGSSK